MRGVLYSERNSVTECSQSSRTRWSSRTCWSSIRCFMSPLKLKIKILYSVNCLVFPKLVIMLLLHPFVWFYLFTLVIPVYVKYSTFILNFMLLNVLIRKAQNLFFNPIYNLLNCQVYLIFYLIFCSTVKIYFCLFRFV